MEKPKNNLSRLNTHKAEEGKEHAIFISRISVRTIPAAAVIRKKLRLDHKTIAPLLIGSAQVIVTMFQSTAP